MTRIINRPLALLLLLLFPGLLLAQDDEARNFSPDELAEMQTEWMAEKLSLDDATIDKVAEINLKYADQSADIAKGDGGKLKKARALKSLNSQKEAEFKAVLTDSQFTAYKEAKAELRAKMKEEAKKRRSEKKAA